MKVQVSEATGQVLDKLVALAINRKDPAVGWNSLLGVKVWLPYSTDWGLGGQIIERECIDLQHARQNDLTVAWEATADSGETFHCDNSALVAAMRAFVTLKLGTIVEIPEAFL